jgi:hypothetical protein
MRGAGTRRRACGRGSVRLAWRTPRVSAAYRRSHSPESQWLGHMNATLPLEVVAVVLVWGRLYLLRT